MFRIGATVCTLYATLGQDGIVHGINETEVEHIFTTEDLLPSLHKIIERVPRVRKIYYVKLHPGLLKTSPVAQADFELSGRKVELSTYDQLRELGHSASDDQFEQSRPVPDDVAVILYTSGKWISAIADITDTVSNRIDGKSQRCCLDTPKLSHRNEIHVVAH